MFLTPASQIGALLMALVCLAAAFSGGRPQQLAAATVFVAWIGSAALEDRRFIYPQYAIFVLDVVTTLTLVAVALIWRRGWLLWVAAFQLLTMATHIAVMLDMRIYTRAYMTAYMIWSYLLLAALLWGAVQGFLERRAGRRDR
ncbi:MAG: hypothetical protein Q8L66_07885 [Caulobacter sp.]|nr:hypothetical protein [Caulobacter sp.]